MRKLTKTLQVIYRMTPELLYEEDHTKWCRAISTRPNQWYCTRPKGHKSLHICMDVMDVDVPKLLEVWYGNHD